MRNLKAALIAVLLIAIGIGFLFLPIRQWFLQLEGQVESLGVAGPVVVAVAYVLMTVLLIPGSAITIGAGTIFGLGTGVLVVIFGANLGAFCSFLLARTFLREKVALWAQSNPKFGSLDRAIGREGFKMVLLSRLSPVFPFTLLNYLLGLTTVSTGSYVLANLLGMLPGTFMYVYIGTAARDALAGGAAGEATFFQQGLKYIGLAATVAVVIIVTRMARRAMAEAEMADRDLRPVNSSESQGAVVSSKGPTPYQDMMLVDDRYDRQLIENCHPANWTNPTAGGKYNVVVLGGGTAGLVSAVGAVGLGARVALIERTLLGGDCLNVGCVPSKGIIRASRSVFDVRNGETFGVHLRTEPIVNFAEAMERMRRLRADISNHDSAHRFKELGIDVYIGNAKFVGPSTVAVDGTRLEFGRAVIATGARASELPIAGLKSSGYYTNETIFTLTELPHKMVVVGAGPIGCELAQSFQRFGTQVTLLTHGTRILPKEDGDAAEIVRKQMESEGVHILYQTALIRVEKNAAEKVLWISCGGREEKVFCEAIVIAVGRTPNTEEMGLEIAGVKFSRNGVEVDDRLRTTNPRIYAAGDICSRFKFTHAADAMARIVLANSLFFGRRKVSSLVIPWCTFTDPEIAHVGYYEADARAAGFQVTTITEELQHNDRAILDGENEGLARVHYDRKSGKILGGTIVARHAGEMISELTLAMATGQKMSALASTIHPYPTQAEILKRVGDAYMRQKLTPTVRAIFKKWFAWRR